MIKTILVAAMISASLGAVISPAAAAVVVRIAPPEPRMEVAPAHRRGYVWAPGYWDSRGQGYNWVKGSWVRERRGYTYASPRWVERDGRWHKQRGMWNRSPRDHDGDGIPNRMDDHPNNPNRR